MVKVIDKAYRLMCFIVVICLALMTLMVFTNTVLRYALKTSIISSEELSRFLFIWMIFCGGIVALADDIHIKVDLLTSRLPKPVARALDAAVNVVLAVICAILAYGGYVQTAINLTNYAPATGVPLGYVYSSVAISGAAMTLICLARAGRAFLPPPPSGGGGCGR